VTSLSFSPDGAVLASASADQTAKLWNVSTGTLITTIVGHTAWLDAVSFSPDGNLIATGGFDNAIKIWDAHTYDLLATLTEHPGGIFDVAFSPDGTKLASGSADYTIKVWDISGLVGPPVPITVTIDIKPGSLKNTINIESNGVIPVAILSTATFDASTVDPLSVMFGPSGAKESHGKGHLEDANGDGVADMVLHFKTQETGIVSGQTEATLTGKTLAGVDIVGSDAITVFGGVSRQYASQYEKEDETNLPTESSLSENYPNPFNPTTTIRYSISSECNVALKIYSALGELVATLVDGPRSPGDHEIRWDARDVPSGVYYCRLQAGAFVGTRKLVLLR